MAIVVFHFGKSKYPFDSDKISFLVQYADVGVSYFFVLSGFIMIIAYGNKERVSFRQYIQNRLARIYPLYVFALVLLLLGWKLTARDGTKPLDLALNLLMIQSWFPEKAMTLNFPSWSLSVEMLFYVSFPFLFNKFYKNHHGLSIAFATFLWLVSQAVLHLLYTPLFFEPPLLTNLGFINYFPLTHLNQFVLGNLTGLIFLKIRHRSQSHDFKILAVLLLIVLTLKYNNHWLVHNGLLAILFAPLILLISLNTGWLSQLFDNRFCIFLGEISYGIYILQVPVFLILYNCFIKDLGVSGNVQFYFMTFMLIVFSALSYWIIEKPMRNLLKFKP